MPTPNELEQQFWQAVKADRTMMLGLASMDEGHARPMTAHIEGNHGPIWFFGALDSAMAKKLTHAQRATAHFSAKNHELFAVVHGWLQIDNDPAVIERLWNRFVAAWYENGKDDPNLALFRFDTARAEIWENASSLLAGVKLLLGVDPKKDYRDKVAEVRLD